MPQAPGSVGGKKVPIDPSLFDQGPQLGFLPQLLQFGLPLLLGGLAGRERGAKSRRTTTQSQMTQFDPQSFQNFFTMFQQLVGGPAMSSLRQAQADASTAALGRGARVGQDIASAVGRLGAGGTGQGAVARAIGASLAQTEAARARQPFQLAMAQLPMQLAGLAAPFTARSQFGETVAPQGPGFFQNLGSSIGLSQTGGGGDFFAQLAGLFNRGGGGEGGGPITFGNGKEVSF